MASPSAKIKALAASIRGLEKAAIKEASADVATFMDSDLARKFASEEDPYGRAWPERKREADYDHPILDDSGRLRASRRVAVMPDGGVEITYDNPAAAFHDRGTRNMAKRQLLPRGPLPAGWATFIKDAVSRAVKRALKAA